MRGCIYESASIAVSDAMCSLSVLGHALEDDLYINRNMSC
jgi:hypothetical protein